MHNQLYFEAIIQIRPKKKEVLDFVVEKIKERKNVFVSKTVELKTGIDFYVSDQRFARALSKQLKKRFNGEVKLTRKLHTVSKKNGKRLYRVTVLFRLKE